MSDPALTHQDWMNIFSGAWGLLVLCTASLVAWLWRHGTRITRAEGKIEQNATMLEVERERQAEAWSRSDKALEIDRQRQDAAWARIESKIDRVADKLDLKADK